MNFKFENIQEPKVDSSISDTVTGLLFDTTLTPKLPPAKPTVPVAVSRYMKHWKVYLLVTIDGRVFHDFDINESEQKQFDALFERALKAQDEANDDHRSFVREIGKQLI